MAQNLSTQTGVDLVTAGYLNGKIKDNETLVGEGINNDVIQFFQKLMSDAGLTANGAYDNELNGYQFISALLSKIYKAFNADPILTASYNVNNLTTTKNSYLKGTTPANIPAGFSKPIIQTIVETLTANPKIVQMAIAEIVDNDTNPVGIALRERYSGVSVWSDWYKYLPATVRLRTNPNLDTILDEDVFLTYDSATNFPPTDGYLGIVETKKAPNWFVLMKFTSLTTGRVFERTYLSGAWTLWREIKTSETTRIVASVNLDNVIYEDKFIASTGTLNAPTLAGSEYLLIETTRVAGGYKTFMRATTDTTNKVFERIYTLGVGWGSWQIVSIPLTLQTGTIGNVYYSVSNNMLTLEAIINASINTFTSFGFLPTGLRPMAGVINSYSTISIVEIVDTGQVYLQNTSPVPNGISVSYHI